MQSSYLPRIAAGLLVAATVTFFFGVTAERLPSAGQVPAAAQPTAVTAGESAEQVACERSGGAERACAKAPQSAPAILGVGQEGSPTREAAERAAGTGEVSVFGVPLESPAALGAVVLVSVGLAIAVWLVPGSLWLLLVVLVFAVVTGFFDLFEIPFQVARGSGLLVALAALAAILHFGAAGIAGVASRRRFVDRPLSSSIDARGGQRATSR